MRSARWLILGAALAAAACDRDRAPGPTDHDGDGVVAGLDCDDTDPVVHAAITAYADSDGDGTGAGPGSAFCTAGSAPPGWALDGADCAPEDVTLWRAIAKPLVDRDGDGYTTTDAAPRCFGATLPEPYREVAQGNDCDDSDRALHRFTVVYRDTDGDGIGTRPRTISCLGEVPAGFSLVGYDADDTDPAITSDPHPDDALALALE